MAEPNRKDNPSWREKYPGWETFEGKPVDPRLQGTDDPNKDPRFDTHVNPSMVVRRPAASFWIWAIVAALVLGMLMVGALYWRFQRPSPRSPETPQGRVVHQSFSLT